MATMEKGRKRIYFSDHVTKDAIANDKEDDGHKKYGKQPGGKIPGEKGGPNGKMDRPKRCCVLCTLWEIIEAEHDPLVPIGHALSPGGCSIRRRCMKKSPALFIHGILQRTFPNQLMQSVQWRGSHGFIWIPGLWVKG